MVAHQLASAYDNFYFPCQVAFFIGLSLLGGTSWTLEAKNKQLEDALSALNRGILRQAQGRPVTGVQERAEATGSTREAGEIQFHVEPTPEEGSDEEAVRMAIRKR